MAAKEVAIQKRAQIDKATQTMLIAVGLASIVLGCAAVLSVYFVKWIMFNAKVMGEKNAIIEDYRTIQGNVENLVNSVNALSDNENLEIMARGRENRCTTFEGDLVDTTNNIELARICSALRVIPDALPSTLNPEATYASLNKLFLETQDENGEPVEPEAIGSGNSNMAGMALSPGLYVIPVGLMIENTANTTRAVLSTIERSIRNFDIQTASIAWRSSDPNNSEKDIIELRGNSYAYYSDPVAAEMKSCVIRASEETRAGQRICGAPGISDGGPGAGTGVR